MLVIWACDKAEYFFGQDWTGGISLKRLGKFVCRDSAVSQLSRNGTPLPLVEPRIMLRRLPLD
jgi:hypothetical protein